jgi:hypothetical protein
MTTLSAGFAKTRQSREVAGLLRCRWLCATATGNANQATLTSGDGIG